MPEINEVQLPGVGVRHELTTVDGERLALLTHRTGRRELAVFEGDDPDRCRTVLHLSVEDSAALGELLGANPVSEAVRETQRLEGVAIDWLTVPAGSPFDGATIADAQLRTATGASVVAIVRGDTTLPAPEPEARLASGDVVVAVGTPDGLKRLRSLLAS